MFKWLIALCVATTVTVHAEIKILALTGSTRVESLNKKLLLEAASIARLNGANITIIDLKDYSLPLYDGDLESKEGMPANAKRLRKLMIENQIIMIASPEYNGSVPPVLKNAIDWASRGEEGGSSRNAFTDKKFILMSTSPGSQGGSRGLVHLRSIIENIGGTVVKEQISIPNGSTAFEPNGKLKDPKQEAELQKLIENTIKKTGEQK